MRGNGFERASELLAEQAVRALDEAEREELSRALAEHPDLDPMDYELAAAAICVASLPRPLEELPAGLRARLERQAETFLARTSDAAPGGTRAFRVRGGGPFDLSGRRRRRTLSSPWLAWGVAAAAACALLVVSLRGSDAGSAPGPSWDELARRAAERPASVVRVAWTPTEDPLGAGVGGEVLWSPADQRGFLRFEDLVPNDPDRAQYQLWIFDAERPAETPVDGGVFDVPPGAGEVVVPVAAKLPVERATLFAVTLERPGGVVVSSRERLLVTAAVDG